MGLKRLIRKIVPKELRNNPLVAVVTVVALGPAALGVIGASTASFVGATVAAQTATAVALGTGVVTAGVTFAQTQDVSEALKSGVRAGAGSFVGSQISSSITNAVAAETGASLADLEPALRELPSQAGIGQSLAGAVSITAGNVAGNAARSVVMGRPIEEGAFIGLTQSVPEFLSISNDVNRLNPIVRDVVASSAQAALTGQDIGDAALAALVRSTQIVSRAINEIPGGQEFMKERPILTKYVVDTVSSALAAELQGKDVSESVINRLVQTTAQVIGEQIENADNAKKVNETQQKYNAAVAKEEEIANLSNKIEDLYTKYATSIDQYNFVAANKDYYLERAKFYLDLANNTSYTIEGREEYARLANQFYDSYLAEDQAVRKAYFRYLEASGFNNEFEGLTEQVRIASDELKALTNELQADISQLVQYSAGLFTDFETDIATVLSPLTAFDDEVIDVTDQDVMAEIQPVTPPTEVTNIADITPQPLPADLQTDLAQSLPSVADEIAIEQPTAFTPIVPVQNLTFATVDNVVNQNYRMYLSLVEMANASTNEREREDILKSADAYLKAAQDREQQIYYGDPIVAIAQPSIDSGVGAPVTEQELLNQIQEVAARPDVGVPTDATELASAIRLPELVITPTRGFSRYYRSADGSVQVIEEKGKFYIVINRVPNEVSAEEANAFLATLPQGSGTVEKANAFLANLPQSGGTPAPDQERSLVEELMLEEMFGGDQGTTDRAGIGLGTEISPVIPGDLTGTSGGVVIGGDTGAGTAATTGTPADVATGAEPVIPTQPAEQPSFSVLFNYLTRGGGSPYAPNKAVFDMEGGLGTAGGGSKETTFKLITINENTGEQTYDVGGKLYTLMLLPSYKKEVLVPKDPSANVVYINTDQFNRPKFVETSIEKVPFPEAEELVKQIEKSEKEGQTSGGTPAGAEGVSGGRTGESQTATTEEQLQPGVRPEEVTSGVVSEEAAPSFPDVISGITEPTIPASVPGQAAGTETGAQPPGAGGIGDEITDEDIIRLIEGEIGTPGGGGEGEEELGGGEGEGQGTGEGEGTGTGTAGEGTGTGAGEEGTGTGRGGEGTGTGTGTGPGTGEGGGQVQKPTEIVLPTPSITTVPRRTFRRPGDAPPYRVTGMDESGILGRKQPLFGGDEDLQRAEWNRRSLRLRRLLGL